MRRLGPPGVAGAESVGVRGNFANMSSSGAEPSPSMTGFNTKMVKTRCRNGVTQNFLYGPFQIEHSCGFVTPRDSKRGMMKYLELSHESCIRARRVERKSTRSKWNILYAGSDLSDEIHRRVGVYILRIHDVCGRDRRTATCRT
jgi:hypothetical protein